VARPIPRLEPVIRATLSCNFRSIARLHSACPGRASSKGGWAKNPILYPYKCPPVRHFWAKRFSGVLYTPVLSSQLFEQCFGLLQVGRVKPFGEPAVDRREQLVGHGPLALLLPQARQARGGTQLPGLGLLAAGHGEGL